jgi:hypothetical protein
VQFCKPCTHFKAFSNFFTEPIYKSFSTILVDTCGVFARKQAETEFWISFTKRQLKIVKTTSAHSKSTVSIFSTFAKKFISWQYLFNYREVGRQWVGVNVENKMDYPKYVHGCCLEGLRDSWMLKGLSQEKRIWLLMRYKVSFRLK